MDVTSLKNSNTPYTKSLKIKMLKFTTTWKEYTRVNGKTSSYLKFIAADNTGYTKGIAYDSESQQNVLKEGNSFLVRGYSFKDNTLKLTAQTRIFKCEPIVVPDTIVNYAVETSKPLAKVKEVHSSPTKTSISIEGIIMKEEAMKSVDVGTRVTQVKEITVSDNTGEVKVSLWDTRAKTEAKCGDRVRIMDGIVKFSTFHGENTLSLNAMSSIDVVQQEDEVYTGCSILAISVNPSYIDVVFCDASQVEKELKVSKSVMCAYLKIDEHTDTDTLEQSFTPLLPLTCDITVKGNQIITIS